MKKTLQLGTQETNDDKAERLFNESLAECLAIRKQRKEIYGNSWMQQDGTDANFYGGVINKVNRLRILHKNRHEENKYESYEDCLKDLVILTLFTMASFKAEK
jgi:hypothetical protein